jgi:hypothetical protein
MITLRIRKNSVYLSHPMTFVRSVPRQHAAAIADDYRRNGHTVFYTV